MCDNDRPEPIHDFRKLREQLTRMGIIVEQGNPYRPIQVKDVDINELRRMEFTDEGIFVFDEVDGKRHQVFLYKRRYHLERYGKPRYHICKCSTIEEFIEAGRFRLDYRRANTEAVSVINWDDGDNEVTIENLPLCKNCLDVLKEKYEDEELYDEQEEYDEETGEWVSHTKYIGPPILRCKTSNDFVQLLKDVSDAENEPQEDVEVDIRGYTRDWEEISYNYRRNHNFTCEQCGIHIPLEIFYLHTHHKNGVKTDNREENLQCLCIRCHANVDEAHRENFSWGQRKQMLEQFNEEYPE